VKRASIFQAAGLLLLLPATALAHTGAGATHGLAHGFAHPLAGADHLLAMLAVGIWAAQRGGERVWLLPLAFVATMIVGFAAGAAGIGLPGVELMIVASVVTLGVLVALASRTPAVAAAAIVGAFALFHGHAHGTEMAAGVSGLAYGAGFAMATALLHVAGVAIVFGVRRLRQAPQVAFVRAAGAAIALAGVVLAVA
jgi:urease accessory protein